ncbi:MAG: efflux RND transporter periplasmic adaptor subunit [Fimbriimonadaceae bacterium]|nr:efflux RND transporter periplasmic adaptor subunit [Fimbriimonadaceae bacterium]
MKQPILIFVGLLALGGAGWYALGQNKTPEPEIEFRYAKAEKGEVVRSISATGVIVALTAVDVKSKAGGNVVKLAVDEGARVKAGQLIAIIDKEDTQALYDQAAADLDSANARAGQAETNLELQIRQTQTAIDAAKANVAAARVRLERAKIEFERQPKLSQASIDTARANYDTALASLSRLEKVDLPQQRADAQNAVNDAKASEQAARNELVRQESLLEKGYAPSSAVDNARRTLGTATANLATTMQRLSTIDASAQVQLRSARLEVDRTRALLNQAKTNRMQDEIARTSYEEAKRALTSAEIALKQAQDAQRQNEIRRADIVAARAAIVRSEVTAKNAKVNLDSTTVVAPRDGVVTKKYLEEGTIIPPGTSTFAQGTSLVQISDVTQLFVECAVDEADIGSVKVGQRVRIVTEAFPNQSFEGRVQRVNPAAETLNNITAVKVRVQINSDTKVPVVPGMNATCEFVTLEKKGVLVVPSQAVQDKDGKKFVRVKSTLPTKPEEREVKVGETGNEGVEILDGLKEGDEVVTAEINLAELRMVQQKMKEAQEGGGLAGGGPRGPGGNRPRATTGGGSRPR